jgi:hypothetical protein
MATPSCGASPTTSRTRRCTGDLFAGTGFDLRDREFDHFSVASLTGASAVETGDGHLDVTIWQPGQPERVVRKD